MKKRFVALLLALVLVISAAPVGMAYSSQQMDAANALNKLGLFAGTGTKPDGTPEYDLDAIPNRDQGITMLVRLLGKEKDARAGSWVNAFTDVETWAKPYVGYAFKNGLTSGNSATKFGGMERLSPSHYTTFLLRALGYKDNVDFVWSNPFALADSLGITQHKYSKNSPFTRGDVAFLSYNALGVKMKNSDKTLLDTLIDAGAVPEVFNEEKVVSQLQATQYSYTSFSFHFFLLKVKNNSSFDIDLDANVTFYDKNGKIVSAKHTSEMAFQHGQEIVLAFVVDEEFDHAKWEFEAEEETYFACVRSDLTYKGTVAKDKVVLAVTNIGTKPAEFVDAYVLFFKDGVLVNHGSTYFTDRDDELKPKKTLTREVNCYDEFDSYEVFLTGRSTK